MELAKVKKYFKNADQCLANFGNEFRMNKKNFKSIHKDQNEFYVNNGQFQIYSEEKGFAKILTTKKPSFSITKEQLRQLTDPKVKEWFPEVFNLSKDFTGWVKTKGELNKKWICYFENGFQKYGICADGNWFTQNIKFRIHGNEFEATEQEVFESLKNEAVKRGYKQGNFECVEGWTCDNFGGFYLDGKGRLISAPFHQGGKVLFSKGIWATIIPTITKSEAEKLLNKKIID